jgi:hypothetical protein
MASVPVPLPKPRNRKNPKPVAKRGREDKQYHTREERAMFQLGNRAALKETT